MFQLSPAALGITLLSLGFAFFLLIRLLVRVAHRLQPQVQPATPARLLLQPNSMQDAVLLIQPGGRVVFANQPARDWLGLREAEINLERIARRVRPGEAFLALCAGEGRASFSLDGRLVDGVSYAFPGSQHGAILIALRRRTPDTEQERNNLDTIGKGVLGVERLDREEILVELSQKLASGLGRNEILQSVLEAVERLIRSDFSQITIWDPTAGHLVPYRLYGLSGADRHLEQIDDRYRPGEGYSGQLVEMRAPLLIPDIQAHPEIKPAREHPASPFRSFLGTTMISAGRLIGTLEIGSITPDVLTGDDFQTLSWIASQAAVALHNAFILQEGDRYAEQLAGLACLPVSVDPQAPTQELFAQLIHRARAILDVEILGFLIYDETRHILQAQAPFHGLPDEFVSLYRAPVLPGSPAEEVWHRGEVILTTDAPEDARLQSLGLDHTARAGGILHALFVPLSFGARRFGYLQAANKLDGTAFTRDETDLFTIVAHQAASVLESIRLSQTTGEKLQTEEPLAIPAGPTLPDAIIPAQPLNDRLVKISRLVLATAERLDSQDDRYTVLFTLAEGLLQHPEFDLALIAESSPDGMQLVQSLGPLPVGINPEALFGQKNPLKYSLSAGQILLVPDIKADPDWSQTPLLRALGARAFLALPVSTTGQGEAAVLATSSSTLPAVSAEEEPLYALLAHQVSIAIRNRELHAETHHRQREVDLLLEFTRQIASPDRKGVLQSLVATTMQAVPAVQACMVTWFDPVKGVLTPEIAVGYPDTQRLKEVVFPSGSSLPGLALESGQALRIDEVDFTRHYSLSAGSLIAYRDATGVNLPVSSLVIPIMTGDLLRNEQGSGSVQGILVLDNFRNSAAFSAEDQALVTSLAQQTALILENMRLYQAAQQRAEQLRALNAASTTITASLQRDELVSTLLEQLQAVIPFDTGTIWLLENGRLIVKAAHGFEDAEERVGLSVAREDSHLFAQMIAERQPISVGDVRTDPRFPALLEHNQRSWLGLPLVAKGNVLGLVALEKKECDFYGAEEIQMASTFASQVAVALENAELYAEAKYRAVQLDQRSQRLGLLNRLSDRLSRTLDINHILEITSQELLQALNPSLISTILSETNTSPDPEGIVANASPRQYLLVHEWPSNPRNLPWELPALPLLDRLSENLGVFTSQECAEEAELASLRDFLAERGTQSLLILPMASGDEARGFLFLHANHREHFVPDEIELARTISNQAAIALENAYLLAETLRLTDDLDRRVQERTIQLEREHHRSETLLRIIVELSASLDLEQVLHRTLLVLNEVIDAVQITCLVYRPGEEQLHHVASIGDSIEPLSRGDHAAFTGDHTLASWVLANRQSLLIKDLAQERTRLSLPLSHNGYRSAIAVPLAVGEELLGAMLLFHPRSYHFSDDQLQLAEAAANQVAVAINNAELYSLIRDQAEDLGVLLRNQQVETSRSHAILEAIAEGVLVTDAGRRITLFNPAAQQILGLEREEILDRSLEHFTGLFGGAARAWIETIAAWSQDPQKYQPGETYAEQITLEDGRVVLVNLAPVLSGEEFLGTVSIFHDITHQVEVDRLKTEFVATVSHELRTPMTSIKGYVEILLMGAAGQLNDQQRHFLEVVNQNNERLAVLVSDLLDISRIETGRVSLALQPVNVRNLVSDAIHDLQARAQEDHKAMAFSLQLPDDLPRAMADPERLRQILKGLLNNAYNYTPDHGQIAVSAFQTGAYIQFDIKDNGIGIPPGEHERVFERFYRGENPLVLATAGTGLGLSIVQQLVEMHNGEIWLSSSGQPGEGSTFSFTLPVYLRNAPER